MNRKLDQNYQYAFPLALGLVILGVLSEPLLPELTIQPEVFSAEFLNWEAIKEWFLNLGANYNVNPYIFGGIYVGAIPFFTLSVGRIIYNYKKGKSIVLPSLSAGFFFVSAYLYLMIAGRNVPWWVYGLIILLVAYGAYSTFRKIKMKVKANEV